MKIYYIAICICLLFVSCSETEENYSVKPIQKGLMESQLEHNGLSRDYLIYIPESYDGQKELPLLFSFHGRGGTMQRSFDYTKFHELAEKESFIVVYPQASTESGERRWNATPFTGNGLPDDVGFIQVLLDELVLNYEIDNRRIYTSGASNGGYFSFQLACELTETFAAMASVMGAMNEFQINNCQPKGLIPVLQIHGTQDQIVTYDRAQAAVQFWIENNGTSSVPSINDVSDIDLKDGSTVKHFVFTGLTPEAVVEHYRVIGGEHDWPGAKGNMDINASAVIWDFVKDFERE